MADKKITELTELTTLTQDDLFVIVDDPLGTPVTKKAKASTVLGGLAANVASAGVTDAVGVKTTLTSNVVLSATAKVRAAEFITIGQSSSSNTANQYGLVGISALSATTSNVTAEHAAAKFVLDVGPAGVLISNTSVLHLEVANTGTRVANVQSFVTFADLASNSTTAQTNYLFDVGNNGKANVSALVGTDGATNVSTLFSNTSIGALTDITHKLRVRVNGEDFYILLANTQGVL